MNKGGLHGRHDIRKVDLAQQRIDQMNNLRGPGK